MSEESILGAGHGENPVDRIKRTVNDRVVIILSVLEGNALKFQAHLLGGPTAILEHREGIWVSDHPDKDLVAQLGEIIESASD